MKKQSILITILFFTFSITTVSCGNDGQDTKSNSQANEVEDTPIEQLIPKALDGIPTTTDATRQLTRIANEAEIDSKVVDDFIRVLDDPDLYDELSLIDKRNIIRLLSNVPGLSDELFQNLLKTFDTNIDELNLAVYNLMNRSENPLSYGQAINDLFSEALELAPLIRKKHGKQFGDYQPPSRTASPSTDVTKKLTLTPGEIEQFNK